MNDTPGKARILLVDDEPISLTLTMKLLAEEYQVLGCASSGAEALRRAREETPDLVISDIVMPGMDGYELCRALKDDPVTRDIPVVFVSGSVTLDDYLSAHDVGGEDFLSTPLQYSELRHMVAHTLRITEDRKRLSQDLQSAFSTAMVAMSSAAEIGLVLQFIRNSFNCHDYAHLADVVISTCGEYGVTACIWLHGRQGGVARNRAGMSSALENGILARMAGFGRIVDFSHRTAINYEHVTLMLNDMPVAEPERYGRLRDHLAVLAESVDARVRALDDAMGVVAKHQALGEVMHQTRTALAVIDKRHRDNQNDTRMILMNMLTSVEQSFATLGMTPSQEDFLIAILNNAVIDVMNLLDHGLSTDDHLVTVQKILEKSENLVQT